MSKRPAIIAITRKGARLGNQLLSLLPESQLYVPARFASEAGGYGFQEPVGEVIKREFGNCRALVLIMAVGVAVRSLASELRSKCQDPSVVVVDEAGKSVVSLLSGHLGGANELARTVASAIGAQPVITTASDVSETIAVDRLGREFGWELENEAKVTKVSAAIVNGDDVGAYRDAGERNWCKDSLPGNICVFASLEALEESGCQAALIITDRLLGQEHQALLERAVIYRPKSLVVGIGCNLGTSCSQIEEAVTQVLLEHRLSVTSIRNIATIDLKRDEQGLMEFAQRHNLPLEFFTKETLSQTKFPSSPSGMTFKWIGTPAVCEPAALLSSKSTRLVVPKTKLGNIAIAVARVPFAGEGESE